MLFTQQKLPIFLWHQALRHTLENLQLSGERAQCTKHQGRESVSEGSRDVAAGLGRTRAGVQETPGSVSEAPSSSIMDSSAFSCVSPPFKVSYSLFICRRYFFFPRGAPTLCCHSSWNVSAGSWPRQVVSDEHTPLSLLRDSRIDNSGCWVLQGTPTAPPVLNASDDALNTYRPPR